MKKLYHATMVVDVVFEATNEKTLRIQSFEYLQKEIKSNFSTSKIDVVNIPSNEHIPREWKLGSLIYGTDKDMTAMEWFDEQDSEYQEYLRLKSKFENA